MPVDPVSGLYTQHERTRNHPFMPHQSLLRKLARIALASGVVIYEVEHGSRESQRMQRALAAIIQWQSDPEVVAWLEDLKARGEIEPEFLK
jgi:hypothetical protein